MKQRMWAAAALMAASLLAGCAGSSAKSELLQISQDQTGKPATIVAPLRYLDCMGKACAQLGAIWQSAKPYQAQLVVAIPGETLEISGVDLYVASGEIQRIRTKAEGQLPAGAQAVFQIPMQTLDKIAQTHRSWVKIHTSRGPLDFSISSNESASAAYESLWKFVQAARADI